MAATRVQEVKGNGGGYVQSFTLTFASNVTATNKLFVILTYGAAETPSIADNRSNTWVKAVEAVNAGDRRTSIWYVESAAAGATTITISSGGNYADAAAIAWEYSGLATSSALDKTASATADAATSHNSGNTATTTQAAELIIGGAGATAANPSWVGDSNFGTASTQAGADSWTSTIAQAREVSATGAYNYNPTSASTNSSTNVATFKLASGSVSTTATVLSAAFSLPAPSVLLLKTGVVSYWKLDESSGNADDSHGTNDLTNNNTVTYTTAKINNGADVESTSSQSLSITDASQSGLQFSTAFTLAGWVKFESLPALNTDMQWAAKWATGSPQRSYRFGLQNSSGSYFLRLGVSSAGSSTVEGSLAWTPTTGTWYFMAVTWDAGSYIFYRDGSNVGSGTTTGVTSLFNNTEPFYLGRSGDGAYFDGMLDEWGAWNRALNAYEISALYKGGTGLTYPFSGDVTASATVLSAAFSTPQPAIRFGYTTTATALSATFSTPTPVAGGSTSTIATVLSAAFSTPSPSTRFDYSTPVTALTASFTAPSPSLELGITTAATVVSAAFSVPAASVGVGVSHSATALAAAFSAPSPALVLDYRQAATVLSAVFSAPAAVAQIPVSITATVLSATFSAPAPVVTGETGNPFFDGLVSYWSMDETSGTRADSHGSNDLTDNNTVGSATGKINNGSDFELSNSEYLSITDAAQSGLDLSGDLSMSGWIKLEQLPSTAGQYFMIIGKDDTDQASDAGRQFNWIIDPSTNKMRFLWWAPALNNKESVSAFAAGDVGTFVHVAVTLDISSRVVTFYVDGVAETGTNNSGSSTSIQNTDAPFCVGARQTTGGSGALFFDGVLDEIGIWDRVLTSTEIGQLYNSGAGLAYPLIVGTNVSTTATVLSAAFSIPAPAPSASVIVSPSVLSASFTAPAPAPVFSSSIPAITLTAAFSAPAASISIGVSTATTVLSAAFVLPVPTVLTPDAHVAATALAAAFSAPNPTVTGHASTGAAVLVATFSAPSPSATGNATAQATALTATFAVQSFTIPNVGVSVTVLTATFSVPTPSVRHGAEITVTVIVGTFVIPSPFISLGARLVPSPLSAEFFVPAPRRTGGLWTNETGTNATFENRIRSSTTFQNRVRSSTTLTNRTRSSATLSNRTRSSGVWDNQDKSEL